MNKMIIGEVEYLMWTTPRDAKRPPLIERLEQVLMQREKTFNGLFKEWVIKRILGTKEIRGEHVLLAKKVISSLPT